MYRRTVRGGTLVALGLAASALTVYPHPRADAETGKATPVSYLVVLGDGADAANARASIEALGGRVVDENRAIGTLAVRVARADFASQARVLPTIAGVARSTTSGHRRSALTNADDEPVSKSGRAVVNGPAAPAGDDTGAEPLEPRQWNLEAVNATHQGSHSVNQSSRRVTVAVLDSGIEADHPDLSGNVDRNAGRNFLLPDMPGHGNDPNVDDAGHGTVVASQIAAAKDGFGMVGVAPRARLVSYRTNTSDGYIFVQPVVDALTHAADNGVDVVNMSFGLDPWLFVCPNNPADTPEQQAEQRAIALAFNRAADYAHRHGVTLVTGSGNGNGISNFEGLDLDNPQVDEDSPTHPDSGTPHRRQLDPSCKLLPTGGNHVISAGATGPTGRKSHYSNYGLTAVDVAAPGGDYYDASDGQLNVTRGILGAIPERVLRRLGWIDPGGNPTNPRVVRYCDAGGRCAYYRYAWGTSFSAPGAAGVAAILVDRTGQADPARPDELQANPDDVQRRLEATARWLPCPPDGKYRYRIEDPNGYVEFTHACVEGGDHTSFFGHGMVDALAAARQ